MSFRQPKGRPVSAETREGVIGRKERVLRAPNLQGVRSIGRKERGVERAIEHTAGASK